MRRALLPIALVLAALALVASGCGSSSSNALDDSLGYLPKNSFAVFAIKTDPNDAQWKNVGKLLDKFPFASQIKDRIKAGISAGGGVSYDSDIKPLLGNDFVVAIPPTSGIGQGSNSQYIIAWKAAGGDVKKLASRGNAQPAGSENGFTLYRDPSDGSMTAVNGDQVVAAKTRPLLDSALKGHGASDRMSESDFNSELGGLSKDALVRIAGNFQAIFAADPNAAKALKVPWVKALRTFGATVSAAQDGVSEDFDVKTAGISATQQPLASGPAAATVVKRPGEVGIGLRGPAQVVKFVEDVASVTSPKSLLNKDKVGKILGVDIDRDIVGGLGANSTVSVALDGKAAFRSDLKDPATFKKTLAKVMKNLPKAQRAQGKPASSIIKGPRGLYVVAQPGKSSPTYIGVIGNVLVIADDPAKAEEIAGQSASTVPGAKGALVITADPTSIVQAVLKKQGNSGAAALIGPTIAAHLQSFAGSVESEAGGLRGNLKLTIK